MDLLRAWAAGAAAWFAWAAASALLHLWLLPLGALAVPHVRLLWIAFTTLTGYTLVTLAAGLAHTRPHRFRAGRHKAATLLVPAVGAALEAATLLDPRLAAADAVAFGTALTMLAAGAALGRRLARAVHARTGPRVDAPTGQRS